MYIVKYSEQVHMARMHELASASSERVHMGRMHELASASPPFERVPNILRYTFNNIFIIYP